MQTTEAVELLRGLQSQYRTKPLGEVADLIEAMARLEERMAAKIVSLESALKENEMEKEIFRFVTEAFGAKSGQDVALKLSEEAGEVAGAVVKLNENRGTEQQIEQEVGDVLIVASQMAFLIGKSITQIRAERWKTVRARAATADAVKPELEKHTERLNEISLNQVALGNFAAAEAIDQVADRLRTMTGVNAPSNKPCDSGDGYAPCEWVGGECVQCGRSE